MFLETFLLHDSRVILEDSIAKAPWYEVFDPEVIEVNAIFMGY